MAIKRHTPKEVGTKHSARCDESVIRSYRWTKASRAYRKSNPFCVDPSHGEKKVIARCVDHIIPRHMRPDLTWDPSNWQALCWACHSRKTKGER